jgi:hypothetical protein
MLIDTWHAHQWCITFAGEVRPKLLSANPSLNVYLNDGDKKEDFVAKGNLLGRKVLRQF